VKTDFRKAGLEAKVVALLEVVESLTLAPSAIDAADMEGLRRAGWKDPEIVQAVLGCAHFNYLNRMADGLGIAFEYESDLPAFEAPPLPRATPTQDASRTSARSSSPSPAPRAARSFSQLLAVHPALEAGVTAWRGFQLRGTEVLSTPRRLAVAIHCAALDHCDAAAADAEALASRAIDTENLAVLRRAAIPANASPLDRAILEHARRLTLEPHTVTREHVDELRARGMDDREIVRLTMLVAYLSFEHRARFGLSCV
jgi:uncharacterized protein YciW